MQQVWRRGPGDRRPRQYAATPTTYTLIATVAGFTVVEVFTAG